MVIAQITDPHLRFDEPHRTAQLNASVAALAAMELPLAAVLVTGDIADDGRPDEYAAAAAALAPIDAPVVLLPGNHDDRAAMRAAFGLPGEPTDPIRSTLTVPGGVGGAGLRIIACDTTIPGADDGTVDGPWLAARLLDDHGTPTLIAMHHVPTPIHVPSLDELDIPASDRRELEAALRHAGNVVGVVAGHVHRGTLGQLGGVPVISAPSSNLQIAFDLSAPELELAESDPPALALHTLIDGCLVTHLQPVPRV